MIDQRMERISKKIARDQAKQKEIIKEMKEDSIPAVSVIAKERRKPFSQMEIVLIAGIALALFSMLMFNIYASMSASTMNRRVQDVEQKIAETKTSIDNLTQHKYELTQRERLQEVADKYGLKLKDENIIHLKP